jgi:hypothetical protein
VVPDPGNVEILSMGLAVVIFLYLLLLFTSNGIQCKYPFVKAGMNAKSGQYDCPYDCQSQLDSGRSAPSHAVRTPIRALR